MTPLDKLITRYVGYMNDWSAKSIIKKEFDHIFNDVITKMQGKSSMRLGDASDDLEYMIEFPTISKFSYISLRLDELHNKYRSEELYDLEKENGTQFDNVTLEKIYPIKFLDEKELKDVLLGGLRVSLQSLNTEFYNVETVKTIFTVEQLRYLNRSLLSRDLLAVDKALNEEKIRLDMSDAEINNIMFAITNKDKFLTTEVRDIFIF